MPGFGSFRADAVAKHRPATQGPGDQPARYRPASPSQTVPTSASGSPLCQDTASARLLEWLLAGPGCGFFEEPMSGVRSVALE